MIHREIRRSGDHEVGMEGDAAQSLTEAGDVEVDQESHRIFAELEVRQELSEVDALELLDGLELDDDLIAHDEIDAIAAFDESAAVVETDRDLSLEVKALDLELATEALFVR